MADYFKIHKTRFTELGYWQIEAGCWSVVDLTDAKPAQVGQHYPTRQALLGNLEYYAAEFGCALARPKPLVSGDELMREAFRSLPVTRIQGTIFLPLPAALWRLCDEDGCGCICETCRADGSRGYWDTIAIAKDAPGRGYNDFTHLVHYPALHSPTVRKAKILEDAKL
jgi:hypothetical protein